MRTSGSSLLCQCFIGKVVAEQFLALVDYQKKVLMYSR